MALQAWVAGAYWVARAIVSAMRSSEEFPLDTVTLVPIMMPLLSRSTRTCVVPLVASPRAFDGMSGGGGDATIDACESCVIQLEVGLGAGVGACVGDATAVAATGVPRPPGRLETVFGAFIAGAALGGFGGGGGVCGGGTTCATCKMCTSETRSTELSTEARCQRTPVANIA